MLFLGKKFFKKVLSSDFVFIFATAKQVQKTISAKLRASKIITIYTSCKKERIGFVCILAVKTNAEKRFYQKPVFGERINNLKENDKQLC
jgi:hypothetical protein